MFLANPVCALQYYLDGTVAVRALDQLAICYEGSHGMAPLSKQRVTK